MPERELALLKSGIFANLSGEEIQALSSNMQIISYEANTQMRSQQGFCVLLEGEISVLRENMEIGSILVGDGFGDWGLWGWMQARVSLRAEKAVKIGNFEESALQKVIAKHPQIIINVLKNFAKLMDTHLEDLSQILIKAYSAPSFPVKTSVTIRFNGSVKSMRIGTPLSAVLPREIDGVPVISALFNYKHVSLNRPIYTSGKAEALTRKSLEGRMVYRLSLALLALEAAHIIDPKLKIRIGTSVGYAYLFEFDEPCSYDLEFLARRLKEEMMTLVEKDVVFRRDYCSLDEARTRFSEQGWDDAVKLIRKSRNSSVTLVSCGDIYATEIVPLTASAGVLDTFDVGVIGNELLLYFDKNEYSVDSATTLFPGHMAKQHDLWLKGMGINCIGDFNEVCIAGDMSKLIHVSEGFHEKRIGQIADQIIQQKNPVKVISIAGPSSSGKTTFLKRLSIQLQINGLTPKCISLDDYYVDRELTVRDENGDYDFEAFEALNIPLLKKQLAALIDGETINIARYDFMTGKNHPNGGPSLSLGPKDILLLEGIHGLNPRMPVAQDGVFRIFINPLTSLALDHANRVSASDVRLLRRIVRDRHTRAITAAENIMRWPSVRRGEVKHIFPYQDLADVVFNTSLVYELSVLRVYAERYLLEVDEDHPAHTVAFRLRRLIDKIVPIYPDHVPQTSLLREFIGGSNFDA